MVKRLLIPILASVFSIGIYRILALILKSEERYIELK